MRIFFHYFRTKNTTAPLCMQWKVRKKSLRRDEGGVHTNYFHYPPWCPNTQATSHDKTQNATMILVLKNGRPRPQDCSALQLPLEPILASSGGVYGCGLWPLCGDASTSSIRLTNKDIYFLFIYQMTVIKGHFTASKSRSAFWLEQKQ